MRVTAAAFAAAVGLTVLAAAGARAALPGEPSLALALVTGATRPTLIVSQRQIERTWGLSEDSVYHEVDIPGWRSEGGAAAMSAALPGSGQAYVGDRKKALLFALVEVVGWTSRWIYRDKGLALQDDAAAYVGTPSDSTSKWTYERWQEATNGSTLELRALYDRDRNVFYDRIANDPSLLAGWSGDPAATRTPFAELRSDADDKLRVSHASGTLLWINHALSAFDALRGARLNNMKLSHDVRLGVSGGWSHGTPTLNASLKRSF